MAQVFLVKGIDPVSYMDDVLAVFGREADAQAFMEHYRAQAEATYDCCADENEYYLYEWYEVQAMEVQ